MRVLDASAMLAFLQGEAGAEAGDDLGGPAGAAMKSALKLEFMVDPEKLRKVGPLSQIKKESRSKAEQETTRHHRIEFGQEALRQSPAQQLANSTPPRPL